MSTYESYNTTSIDYDKTRVPIGVEIIIGCLSQCEKPLSEVKLLDAGCGTGSYSHALVKRVSHIDAIDLSEGMLNIATEKLAPYQAKGKISFHHGNIAELPFEDEQYDGVMFNQVLHHIDTDGTETFPVLQKVLQESYRVLRPGGVLTINTCSQRQLKEGIWYCRLVPETTKILSRRYVSLPLLRKMIEGCGFLFLDRIVPLEAVYQGSQYLKFDGPLYDDWRAGDSVWALVTEEKLLAVKEKISSLLKEGKLEEFVKKLDEPRYEVGQATFCFAKKPIS